MMKKLSENKYKLSILGLLIFSSLVSITIYIVRIFFADAVNYTFLPKNLFLAWIPMFIALVTYIFAEMKYTRIFVPISMFLWLIFFPNAPYLITDFKHLQDPVAYAPSWADVLLLVWFAWTGFLLGIVSLYLMHVIIKKTFGWSAGWFFVFGASTLGAIGIYIGRFLRFNSWDVLQNPITLLEDIWRIGANPMAEPGAIVFPALFAMLFLFVYLLMYAFGHAITQEQ